MYDGLFWLSPSGVVPQLVTNYSQNGNAWIFHLRQGVSFSDGTPFNSSAVVASLNRQNVPVDPVTNKSSVRYSLYSVFTGIKAIDTYTFEIDTASPNPTVPALLANMGGAIDSPSAVAKYGANYGTQASMEAGTGPYMAQSFTPGVSLTLVRNPHYWGTPGYWSTITFKQLPDDSQRLQALQAGTIDVAIAIAPSVAISATNSSTLQLLASPTIRPCFYSMNLNNASSNPLHDPRVRLALNLAINRTAIVDDLLHGYAGLSYQMFAPGQVGYPNVNYTIPYDPAQAKNLLAQAGYPNGFSTKILISSWVPSATDVATAVQGYLSAIGVKAAIDNVPPGTYFSEVTSKSIMSNYSLRSDCWGPLTGLSSEALSGELSNNSFYINASNIAMPAVQGAIDAVVNAPTYPAYISSMQQAATLINNQSLVMPLFVQKVVTGTNPTVVKGIVINPQGVLYFYYGHG